MTILIKNVSLKNKRRDIFIEDNIIREINEKISLEADFKIDGKDKVIIPSFVNAHTHSAMTLLRGYADDMVLQEWLEKKIWPIEAKLTEKDVYWGAKLACLEMIKTGTTVFNDMYWHFHGTAKAVDEMGIRGLISSVLIDFFDSGKAEEQKKTNKKIFEESKKYSDRVMFSLGPHAIYTVSQESLQWAKEFSEKNNLLIHIHLSETQKEVEDCLKQYKKRPVEYLEHLGFLGPNVIAAHGIWLNNKEIEILNKYDVKIVHNPVSNMKLCSGVLPYKKLKKAGVTVALGTDGCCSNNNLDMLEEAKFASLLQKLNNNPTVLPAREAFNLLTINGARTVGLNCGEITEGKLADILLINLKEANFIPNHNSVSNLIYASHGNVVDTTICDGKILMMNRKVEGEEDILEKANEVAFDLARR